MVADRRHGSLDAPLRRKDCGLQGLTDRSRRPYRQASRLPLQIKTLIVRRRRCSSITLSAISTVHAVLDRHVLIARGLLRARVKVPGTTLCRPDQPNDPWCVD